MPHSSGGGSSHGGSHSGGGSFHSSGGGSSHGGSSSGSSAPKPEVYSHYAPGRHVYVRYDGGVPRYMYGNYSYGRMRRGNIVGVVIGLVFAAFLAAAFVIPGIGYIIADFRPPARLTSGEEPVIIVDETGAFTDAEEADIEDAAERYYDLTGIPIYIHVISEETFEAAEKDSLEVYAYYDYVRNFSDESHWLLVLEDVDRDAGEWEFEGMQGDDTDEWLTYEATDEFNDDLTSALWRSDGTYGEAFATAIDELADRGFSVDWDDIGETALIIAFPTLTAVVIVACSISELKENKKTADQLKGYHEVKTEAMGQNGPVLVTCPWCGGTYVFGETSCPHCNAPGRTTPS